jgi:uncharacterized membrane protein YidH (DUF202 family)
VTGFPDRQGLQPERTALAWQRTAILAAVVLLPSLVVDVRIGAWRLAIAAAVTAMTATAIVLAVQRRLAQLLDDAGSYSPYAPMAGVGAVTVLGAASGVATALALLLR